MYILIKKDDLGIAITIAAHDTVEECLMELTLILGSDAKIKDAIEGGYKVVRE